MDLFKKKKICFVLIRIPFFLQVSNCFCSQSRNKERMDKKKDGKVPSTSCFGWIRTKVIGQSDWKSMGFARYANCRLPIDDVPTTYNGW